MAMRTQTRETARPEAREGAILRPEAVEGYLQALAARGRGSETVRLYGAKLRALYQYLPEDKRITRETLGQWQEALLESGYSPGTVNTHLSAANGLLDYMGRRDLQVSGRLEPDTPPQPELTRGEYLRLLTTAKALGREKAYLLVKIFAVTGLAVNELPGLTAASVKAGKIRIPGSQERQAVRIPPCLQGELLSFLAREGITAGPVFVTRKGTRLRRTAVAGMIQNLAQSAQVAPEKCNARCLRRLFAEEQEAIWSHLSLLAQQMYDQLLDEEQAAAGWDETVKP